MKACGISVLGFALVCATAAGAQSARDWPSEAPPRPLPARQVNFPPYEVRTLDNGMQVVTVLHHEQPAVSVRLLVRAGAAQDPKGKGGAAMLTAALLDQGTTTKSAFEVADTIDSIGGRLGAGAGSDLSSVDAVVMKDSFVLAMDLLADVVRNPAFADGEIERQKQQALSGLQVSAGDPDYLASVVFDRLVYGFHPYGLPNTGTADSLASLTRADLQEFHARFFVPNNMILAIVGDVTREEAFGAAERVFGTWERSEVPVVKTVEPPPSTRRVVVVDKPDAVQTEIRVGHLGIPRKHADYMAVDLAFKILGGEGANRLHRVLRSERGLTYGASADIQTLKQAGDFMAETDTRTETTGEALRLIFDEYSRLRRERVHERELADAQAYLAGSFPLTIETPGAIARQVLNAVFYELPLEEIPTYRERVQAVTPDDVQRVARAYLSPDRLSVVLVGNAAGFVGQLKGLGFSDFEVIPIAEVDLMAASLRRDGRPADPAVAPKRPGILQYSPHAGQAARAARGGDPARARELIARLVEAKGGLARLKAVRTVTAVATTTLHLQQGPMESTTKTYIVYPDQFRVDAAVAGANIVQVYNAGEAWMTNPAGTQDAPPPVKDSFAASVRRDMIPLLIGAAEGALTATLLPEEGQDGRTLRVVEISGEGLAPVRLYADAAGLVVRQSFTAPGPDGRDMLAEESFSDYREIDGVKVPFVAALSHDGRPVLTRTLTDVRFNAPIDARLFSRPD
ncbi:MAG: insulinase family protein [Vicinamibacterales bacterium]